MELNGIMGMIGIGFIFLFDGSGIFWLLTLATSTFCQLQQQRFKNTALPTKGGKKKKCHDYRAANSTVYLKKIFHWNNVFGGWGQHFIQLFSMLLRLRNIRGLFLNDLIDHKMQLQVIVFFKNKHCYLINLETCYCALFLPQILFELVIM